MNYATMTDNSSALAITVGDLKFIRKSPPFASLVVGNGGETHRKEREGAAPVKPAMKHIAQPVLDTHYSRRKGDVKLNEGSYLAASSPIPNIATSSAQFQSAIGGKALQGLEPGE